MIFHPLDFDCPADGLCSNHGKCNVSIGICICDQGYEGINCQGNFWKIEILALWKNMPKHDIFLDKLCPGGSPPCNGKGLCDHTTGSCQCIDGNQGLDCSGNFFNLP